MESKPTPAISSVRDTIRKTLIVVGALILFLFSLDLMISSFQHLSKNIAETILMATSNPFTGLFIGLLVTAMIQSSSTTTSLVVALVASGSITLQNAVPIIMGANIGTTITSTIVSLGFISKKKEFRRAVAAGTYHDFFNILTVVILFPLEYYYGFLSGLSQWITGHLFTTSVPAIENKTSHFRTGFGSIVRWMIDVIPVGWLAVLSFISLFSSILLFRKIISEWIRVKTPERFSQFFFKNQIKSFAWGTLITAAIRSSTITTSLVVPLVAKKVVTLRMAAPFILGANMGTTITAFIAATLNTNTAGAVSIAIAHFLFNFIGVLIFFPIPVLREFPIRLAQGLGRLTLRYRLAGFVYLLLTFFFIPFSLIYFNQDTLRTFEITYRQTDTSGNVAHYRIISRMNQRTQNGEWARFDGELPTTDEEPVTLVPVSFKNNSFYIGKDMFLFNKAGFCWDGEDDHGKFRACVDSVYKTFRMPGGATFDSVYVTRFQYATPDSVTHRYYLSAPLHMLLRHEQSDSAKTILASEEVVRFQRK